MDASTALINDKSQPRATLAAAHYNRGTVYLDWAYAVPFAGSSDFDRAAADFDEAISLDPRHAANPTAAAPVRACADSIARSRTYRKA